MIGKKKRRKTLACRVDEETYKMFNDVADEIMYDVSGLLRRLVEVYLKHEALRAELLDFDSDVYQYLRRKWFFSRYNWRNISGLPLNLVE